MPRRRRPPRPGALADLSPLRIATQIVILQAGYYLSATILLVFTAFTAGTRPSLDLLFSWRLLRADITDGWMFALVWMLNSLITYVIPATSLPFMTDQPSVVPLLLLIARSKLVPDFALTIHAIHLLICALYSRALPTSFFWWALQAASASLMTALGIWSCQWRELQPITFGAHGGSANTSTTNGVGGTAARIAAKLNLGSSHDGGAYEMVPQRT